jgi:CRISPR-associated exonuclease Cas4
MMLTWALILFILALVFFFISSRARRSAGLPGGRVIYADTGKWEKVEKPLYDPVTKVIGRPDYIVRKGKEVIPVEVKSGAAPESPYDSHIFQLAAYCLLVEREFGRRPSYGIIHYGKRTFSVVYTKGLENALLDLLVEIRQDDWRRNVDRSHSRAARCRGCGFSYTCDQALG